MGREESQGRRLYTKGADDVDSGRGHPSRGGRGAVLGVVLCLAGPATATSAGGQPAGLDGPVTALWTAVPLRAWADRATALAGRPVIVDRRIDPDAAVSRDCRAEPLADVLAAVAADAGGMLEPLGSSIRIVPAAAAGRATRGAQDRAAEIARLPPAARTTLAARRPWSWADGARPRDLVGAAAAAAGVAVSGIESVPHDHLPGATLPPLSLAERLDLVLAHYDLRLSWAAAADSSVTGAIVPLPAGPAPANTAGVAARPRRSPGNAGGETRPSERYTLKLEAPLDAALAALGPRLGLEPEIDRESLATRGILPGEIVRVAVTDATREQLLDALVAPLGLRWRIDDRRLVIDAPPPD